MKENKKGDVAAAENYKNGSKSDADRHNMLAKFVVDPDVSRLRAFHNTSKENIDGFRGKKRWLSLAQMSGPKYFNSEEDAKLIAKACEDAGNVRPHSSPSVAAQGRK